MKRTLFLAAVATASLTGCYSLNTVSSQNPAVQRQVIADKRVVWDGTLAGKLAVGQVIAAPVSGNLLHIQADVTNQYAYAIDFGYRVEWFDLHGMRLSGPTDGWKRLHLEAHESSTISATAVSPQAADFVLKFQESKGSNTIF